MRSEFKYLFEIRKLPLLLDLLHSVGTRDVHAKTKPYAVKSLYFDSLNLAAYTEKMEGVFSRHKYRIRFLANTTRLEKKCKEGILGYKERYIFGQEPNDVFLTFSGLVNQNKLFPILTISYVRHAFIVGDSRITIDTGLRASAHQFSREICPGTFVLEVKFINGYLPQSILHIIRELNGNRVAFSKYCKGVECIYGRSFQQVIPERFSLNTLN